MAIVDQQQERVPSSRFGWVLILLHLALGFLTIALAVDQSFASGKVVFDHERWRIVLGIMGGYLTFRAARGVVRTINRTPLELGPEQYRRSRLHGFVLLAIGAAFFVSAQNDKVGELSVDFVSWTKPVYIVGGIYVVLMGLVSMIDFATVRQRQEEMAQRMQKGPFGE